MYRRGGETATALALHGAVRRFACPDPVHPQGFHQVRRRPDGAWVRAQVRAWYVWNHRVSRRVRVLRRVEPLAMRLDPFPLGKGQLLLSARGALAGLGKTVPCDGESGLYEVR